MLVLSGTGTNFNMDAIVPQVMGGLPRFTMHSSLNLTYWWVHLFGAYWGYILNKFFLIFLAAGGMYLWMRDYVFKEDSNKTIALGIAVIYSWIPFYPVFGASFVGIPLVIWSFLKILQKKGKWYHFIPILIFPFYSSIVWGAPAILLVMLYFTWKEWKSTKLFKWIPWVIMIGFGISYLISNFQLLWITLSPPEGFISHREAYNFKLFKPFSFKSGIENTVLTLFLGQYHVGTFFTALVWLTLCAYLWVFQQFKSVRKYVVAIFLLAVFVGFYGLVIVLLADKISLVETFRFERLNILLPWIYLSLLGTLLFALCKAEKWRVTALVLLVSQLLIGVFINDEFIHNIRHITNIETKANYKQFYDEELFTEIEQFIGKEKSAYRVGHIGLPPAISQHNGFYTIDGLQAVYGLDHKLKIQDVIEEEIEKDPVLERYFKLWGNRCYLLSSELGKEDEAFMISKDEDLSIQALTYNTDALKALNCNYIFSSVEIDNADKLNWSMLKTFSHDKSYWRIILYQIN